MDLLWLKAYVFSTWILDTAHQVLLVEYIYSVFVKGIVNPAMYIRFPKYATCFDIWNGSEYLWATQCLGPCPIPGFLPPSFMPWFNFSSFVVPGFVSKLSSYMKSNCSLRLTLQVSNNNIILTGVLVFAVLGQLAMNLVYVGMIYNERNLLLLSKHLNVEIALNSVIAFTDTLLSVVVIWLLRKSRSGFQRTDSIINRLVMYTVGSGFVTSIWMIIALIASSTARHSLIYALADLVLPKCRSSCAGFQNIVY